MISVNLKDPDHQICQHITKSCAMLGSVKSVKVFRSPSAFALVEMSSVEQTYELAAGLGGSSFGTCALIHLQELQAA